MLNPPRIGARLVSGYVVVTAGQWLAPPTGSDAEADGAGRLDGVGLGVEVEGELLGVGLAGAGLGDPAE